MYENNIRKYTEFDMISVILVIGLMALIMGIIIGVVAGLLI